MSFYSINKPNRTVTIHKDNCKLVNKIKTLSESECGCCSTGDNKNHRWFCEEHITREEIDNFMNDRYWAILICNKCFKL